MLNKKLIRSQVIIFVLLAILSGVFGLSGVGLAGFILGVTDLFAALLFLLFRKKTNGLTLLLCSGVLLLIGFSLCSAFPLSFH